MSQETQNNQANNKNKKQNIIIITVIVIGSILSAAGIIYDSYREEPKTGYKGEIEKLGFPTAEIDKYIRLASDQYYFYGWEVTSVKENSKWSVDLYMNVKYKPNFKAEEEKKKGVLELHFEPSNGKIWDATFEYL